MKTSTQYSQYPCRDGLGDVASALRRFCLAFFALCISLTSLAWDFTSGGFYYEFTGDDEVALCRATDERGASLYHGVLVVPERVYCEGMNYRVAAIADSAMLDADVTEVQLPRSVTRIGRAAFAGCDRLGSLTLPLDLEAVPPYMMAGTDVANLAVPDGVAEIGEGAFSNCVNLHTVFLPASLTELGAGALSDCFNLFEVYCAAPWPPLVSGCDNFLAMSGIDLIVESERALGRYADHPVWGDGDRFSLWTNDDIYLNRGELPAEEMGNGFTRVGLGGNMAFRIYGPDGYPMALTAADHYYIATPEGTTDYVVAATNLIHESDNVLALAVGHTPTAIELPEAEKLEPEIWAYGGAIYVRGDRNGTWTSVYGTDGRLYYQHPTLDTFIDGLPQGRIYIVIVGNTVRKVAL
ncbi:MAG: leucine-rich repeat domain-containing protein [Muribaculaceae bacterium]|nr:leucine-rich repeat domain-containing protein [Muribaculaceae bacterium]